MHPSPIEKQLSFNYLPPVAPSREAHQPGKLKTVFGALDEHRLLAPFRFGSGPYEYKVIALRECPTSEHLQLCDTPEKAAKYWRRHVAQNPYFNQECECFAVFLLNTRRRIKGHQIVATGTMDTILVHPREVFRLAVITAAAAIILAHNHPSGDPAPSEADIKVTRDLIRAGQLMKLEILDHVIVGNPGHCSLRELGYFYQ
jgi:DNA repair protein RadC